jgi:hypothetical protein
VSGLVGARIEEPIVPPSCTGRCDNEVTLSEARGMPEAGPGWDRSPSRHDGRRSGPVLARAASLLVSFQAQRPACGPSIVLSRRSDRCLVSCLARRCCVRFLGPSKIIGSEAWRCKGEADVAAGRARVNRQDLRAPLCSTPPPQASWHNPPAYSRPTAGRAGPPRRRHRAAQPANDLGERDCRLQRRLCWPSLRPCEVLGGVPSSGQRDVALEADHLASSS